MRKIVSYLTIICLLLITFSCGGGGSSKGVSPVTVLASFKTSSAGAAMKAQATTLTTIRYTVTGSGMETMTDTVPVTSNLVEFTLEVPNGTQRHFLIEALDSSNNVRYKGEAYKDLDGTPVTITIDLVSTTPNQLIGKWGQVGLEHHNDGKWESYATTFIFNADGTGTETSKSNDGGVLTSETKNFTYSITPNQDGSFTLTLVYPDGTKTPKIVFSDDGNMVIIDRTTDTTEQRLDVAIKMDTSKIYTNTDTIGEYFKIGYAYEASAGAAARFNSDSSIFTFDGIGNISVIGKLNSDGVIHDFTNFHTYLFSPDGSVTFDNGGLGYLSGDNKLFVRSLPDSPDAFRIRFGMKKGDRIYSTADLAGTWALVGFGDDYGTSFNAEFGTITCDSSGNCIRSSKNQRDGNIQNESDTINLSVSPDGSFGASLATGAPSYAGAIGNNGNSIVFNVSFDQSQLYHREIFIGVRCSACGDLVPIPPSVPTNLTAAPISAAQIDLSWNPSTDNVAVAGYKVYDSLGTYLKSVTTTSTSITGLSPDTQYCFTVSAYDTSGNESGKSSQACATTLSVANQLPTATLSADKTSGTASLTVTFTIGYTDPEGKTGTHSLDFGDGSAAATGSINSGATAQVPHSYDCQSATCTYTALLTVADDVLQTDTKSVSIAVTPATGDVYIIF
jgi:hypothetical protein